MAAQTSALRLPSGQPEARIFLVPAASCTGPPQAGPWRMVPRAVPLRAKCSRRACGRLLAGSGSCRMLAGACRQAPCRPGLSVAVAALCPASACLGRVVLATGQDAADSECPPRQLPGTQRTWSAYHWQGRDRDCHRRGRCGPIVAAARGRPHDAQAAGACVFEQRAVGDAARAAPGTLEVPWRGLSGHTQPPTATATASLPIGRGGSRAPAGERARRAPCGDGRVRNGLGVGGRDARISAPLAVPAGTVQATASRDAGHFGPASTGLRFRLVFVVVASEPGMDQHRGPVAEGGPRHPGGAWPRGWLRSSCCRGRHRR